MLPFLSAPYVWSAAGTHARTGSFHLAHRASERASERERESEDYARARILYMYAIVFSAGPGNEWAGG